MLMLGVDDSSLPVDWQPSGAQSAFIEWTWWTLTMASPLWWHLNTVIGIRIIIIIQLKRCSFYIVINTWLWNSVHSLYCVKHSIRFWVPTYLPRLPTYLPTYPGTSSLHEV